MGAANKVGRPTVPWLYALRCMIKNFANMSRPNIFERGTGQEYRYMNESTVMRRWRQKLTLAAKVW